MTVKIRNSLSVRLNKSLFSNGKNINFNEIALATATCNKGDFYDFRALKRSLYSAYSILPTNLRQMPGLSEAFTEG